MQRTRRGFLRLLAAAPLAGPAVVKLATTASAPAQKAAGGVVRGGQPYLVGEAAPPGLLAPVSRAMPQADRGRELVIQVAVHGVDEATAQLVRLERLMREGRLGPDLISRLPVRALDSIEVAAVAK